MNFFEYNGVTVTGENGVYVLYVNRLTLEVKPVDDNAKQRWVRQEVWHQPFEDLAEALKAASQVSGLTPESN